MTDATTAVFDAMHEASIVRPEIAAADSRYFVSAAAIREAFDFIPDEHRRGSPRDNIGSRFVASVIANAQAAERSPYTVAMFAFDIA